MGLSDIYYQRVFFQEGGNTNSGGKIVVGGTA